LHAPEDKEIVTVDEILHYAVQPGVSHLPNCLHAAHTTQVSYCIASLCSYSHSL
jgi:hypothetical protein